MTNIHRIQVAIPYPVKWVNCYYIEDSLPTLIDTGLNLPDSFEVLAKGIGDAGGDISSVRRIIATHGHMDHSGLAGKIQEISGADFLVHASDQAKLSNDPDDLKTRMEAFHSFLSEAGVPDPSVKEVVSRLLEMFSSLIKPVSGFKPLYGGEVFGFDDFELHSIHTPGHSPGSICLHSEEKGILFSGDCILEEVIVDPMSDIRSLVEHQASLDMIAGLPVRKVLPGHGAAFSDHRRRIRRIRDRHKTRSDKILSILERSGNGKSRIPFSIASELFSSMSGMDALYCVSSVVAHLELLEFNGTIDSPAALSCGGTA
ncbi:MAG: MBL fold metallo-hydrolase [Desulfomonile tiedjei]|uniref:MBL fold metallo-hydrolase n=1 Tax=Desulfomonile tiedjei TaxID=2358 RepID=A0A9D6Z466_9BACT|nr:MBL fold metallo-hydrolase [Desulfomonile tiedjei]